MITYPLPDGGTTTVKPKDGELFFSKLHGQFYQWDDMMGFWLDTSQWATTYGSTTASSDLSGATMKTAVNPTKICECGKEKHGFFAHSSWCDIKD